MITVDSEKEKFRLYAVQRFKELELQQDENLQQIVHLASYIFQTPIALLTLMDENEQLIISKKGADIDTLPRQTSFCTYAIEQDVPMVVSDATADNRFSNVPSVKDQPHIRFYAGVPLKSPDGYNVGTLCVFDNKPGKASEEQLSNLQALTNQVATLLELKLTFKALSESINELAQQNMLLKKIAQVQSHELRAPVSSIKGIMNVIKYEDYHPDKNLLMVMENVVDELDNKVCEIVSLASNNNEGFNHIQFPVQ